MIRKFSIAITLAILCLSTTACENGGTVSSEAALASGTNNIANPAENIFTSGQPSREEFAALAELGVKHVVNLRPQPEQDWDEAAYASSLGMQYHSIPVADANDITPANAEKLKQTLQSMGSEPALVHCASGNRVGALIALQHGLESGDVDAAIAEGKRWGLTRLEPVVRNALTK